MICQNLRGTNSSIDGFIDELVEGEESSSACQTRTSVNLTIALQQEVNLRSLPPIPLIRFVGNLNGLSLLKTFSQESIESKHLMITLG